MQQVSPALKRTGCFQPERVRPAVNIMSALAAVGNQNYTAARIIRAFIPNGKSALGAVLWMTVEGMTKVCVDSTQVKVIV